MSDVSIDQDALHMAKFTLDSRLGDYRFHGEHAWGKDTGVGNPAGRTLLRVMLENAIGQALMTVRGDHAAGFAVSDQIEGIGDAFEELDASLGEGWDHDYVTDLS